VLASQEKQAVCVSRARTKGEHRKPQQWSARVSGAGELRYDPAGSEIAGAGRIEREAGKMAGKRVLLVDDDVELVNSLAEQLHLHEEFETVVARTGAEGLEAGKDQYFDALLLDVGLPDMDGRDLCRLMRRNGIKAPIIMLTGADSEADTILGLDAGANDYVTKPFKLAVLLARLRAQLRQHEMSEEAVFALGPYTFQPAQKVLIDKNEKKVRLTEKETAILKYLYRTGDSVVSREKLLHEVWGYNAEVTTHTLETHIYRLRQKIEEDPSNASILITEKGGYRLNA